MQCCVKLGSLELRRKIVLAHFITLIKPARYQLAPEVSREELFKHAKSHGMHHDGHKHLCNVQIFAVDTA
jgi:hypothetical protein